MTEAIRITCEAADLIPVEDFREFQGELKALPEPKFEELKRSILSVGFSFPMFVWRSGRARYIIDGHQRLKVIRRLLEEGYELKGGALPVAWIRAKTREEAKKKVLLAISQYGELTDATVAEFIKEAGLALEDLRDEVEIPDVPFPKLEVDFFDLEMPDKPERSPGEGVKRSTPELTDDDRDVLKRWAGYHTALERTEPSLPMQFYESAGLLAGDVLDYGAGRDVHSYERFDPEHRPVYKLLRRRWDVVTSNYVLNVIPLVHNRIESLLAMRSILKPSGYLLVSVYRPYDGDAKTATSYQCGWTAPEWDAFLREWFPKAERLKAEKFWGWKLTP